MAKKDSQRRFLFGVPAVYLVMKIPTTMRALRQTTLMGPQDLRLVTGMLVPVPQPGEVLVRVACAGVNFADISKAYGKFGNGPTAPFVAGFEAVGQVVAMGDGVSAPNLGALVAGVVDGAFAEYVVLPARAALPVPTGWTAEQALGLVVNYPTALAVLRYLGKVAAGETVLLHAAAGATGQAALRLAKHFGATVIAVASPSKHETVRELGADQVLDARDQDLTAKVLELTRGQGADLVLECAGGAMFGASLAATKRVTGRVVVYGAAGGEATLRNLDLIYRYPLQVIGFNLGTFIQASPALFGELLGELFALIASGVVPPACPTVYPMHEGAAVLKRLEDRVSVGKLALKP